MNNIIFNNINTVFLEVFNRPCTADDYNLFYKQLKFNLSYNNIKKTLTCNYVFIPRDSGFFSVFNYLIGLLHYGYKVYPYWNYDICLKINKSKLRHFCYLDKSKDNCWFEYFEPISYFENDNNNFNTTGFTITQGMNTPKEFKYIDYRRNNNLINNYQEWRQKVNKTYIKFIKPIKYISDEVDKICANFSVNMIAVHYRHPSHGCEQGNVYFNYYFKIIDKLIKDNTNAMIYLATDNDLGLLVFKDRYKEKIIYREDVKRTCIDNILDWAYASNNHKSDNLGFINNVGYQVHYDCLSCLKMGYDVLIDALCLSKCNYFVHTISNISFAVSYINPDIQMLTVCSNN
jgi:hypothetical protein